MDGITIIGSTDADRRAYRLIMRLAIAHVRFMQHVYADAQRMLFDWLSVDRRDDPEFYNAHMAQRLADDPEALAIWQAMGSPAGQRLMDADPRAHQAMLTALIATLETRQPVLLQHLFNVRNLKKSHQEGIPQC